MKNRPIELQFLYSLFTGALPVMESPSCGKFWFFYLFVMNSLTKLQTNQIEENLIVMLICEQYYS